MDQALNSQKTPHTSPLRASYGMSFVSILMKNDRVIKGFTVYSKQHSRQLAEISWKGESSLTAKNSDISLLTISECDPINLQ